jgi:predicted O-linked N-acetylglucosamine transferase (SPINDLY family)
MIAAVLGDGAPESSPEDAAGCPDWLLQLMRAPGTILTAGGTLSPAAARLADLPLDALISQRDAQGAAVSVEGEIALYRGWIAANPGSPLLPGAWFNLGVGLARNGERDAALAAYQAALAIRPDFHVAAVNLGLLYESAGQAEEALATWTRSIQPTEARIALQTQAGRLLEATGRHQAAEAIFTEILALDPAQADVRHHWLHLRQKTCLWPVMPPGSGASLAQSGPFGIMALTDDVAEQRAAAATWIARKTVAAPLRLAPDRPYGHDRLRIGYLSSDFCSHAMAYLIAEVFERHDRTRFTVYGYCATLEDHSPVRRRLLAGFDHYRPIRSLSDEDAARVIREDEIDILVDLNGITDGSRLAVLRWRPAPIQATYLGFVGPVPLPELDYLFCDAIVIPPEHAAAYGTRPLPIGPIYQANDSKRTAGPALTRAAEGLPEDRFILACFSKHYKITQEIFAAWMEILAQVPHAVLWLMQDNADSQRNLRQAARRAGIDDARLIFSDRVDPALYMSRFQLADLFLDTFPYNAGTVASDALRMGLPLITLCGRAFAARMATSLLHAMDAHEGIATSLAHYVEIAVRLARDGEAYRQYRARFSFAAWRRSIGNTDGFMAAYETSLLKLMPTDASNNQLGEAGRDARHPPLPDGAQEADGAFRAGLACSLSGDHAAAAAHYRTAIAHKPDHIEACLNLGTAVLALGQPEAALAFYRKAIEHDSGNAMAYGNLGKALHDLGRFNEATEALERAIALNPDNAIHDINLSATLMERARWDEARIAAERAIARLPTAVIAYCNLGKCLINLGLWDKAADSAARAAALNPEQPIVQATLGGIMVELGQWQAALPLLSQAVGAEPALASGWFNLSHAYRGLNRFDEATTAILRALSLKPDDADYHFHFAHLLLLRGDETRGWAEYEWRWKLPGFGELYPEIPRWQGEPLQGRSILVTPEQGLGDIIQAARYLPRLVAEARRVVVLAPPAARRLLQSINGIEIAEPEDAAVTDCDVASPIMSLPWALSQGKTRRKAAPAPVPYLQAAAKDRRRWQARLPHHALRVGIVWAGNPAAQRDRFRSPGLAAVLPLMATAGARFVVLQMGPGRADLARHCLPSDIIDLGPEIADLADTAAIMTGLDLVISSCTAPLHLAGALGVRAWGMIPFTPHFTWGPSGAASACYPSVRLYRQGRSGQDWSDVVTRMAADLEDLTRSQADPVAERPSSCAQRAAS